ncbi:receptor-like protein 9DC3 isoform X1 [Trifolium pratense]|uniref:receptor-like protein 9DC3 isoform X1 n=2 Tax=Trifolium pratense TaxID=57577 RepID=UPI001E693849|nr:receptor-like protein 9DC3 isoform X1 [Trifolium pratense]
MRLFLLYFHILLFHFPSLSSSSSNLLCHPEDSYALLQFKSSFTIYKTRYACKEQPQKTATWKNGTSCCSWHGVTCDSVSGHVIGLNLGCESLQGNISPNHSTLFRLSHLQSLNLSYNDFSGTNFHSQFSGFKSLRHLDLSSSNFQGEIPPQISHLSKLTSLHLSKNDELIWKESTLKSLVQNATVLEDLFLDETNMSSINPNLLNLIFNQSSSLISLSLQRTRLHGNWKNNILCLPSIQELDMSINNLQGHLPNLSCSTSLRILDLSYCLFTGPIPLSFSNLTYLTSLSLIENILKGSIPSSLLTHPSLTILSLRDNLLISGQIPNVFLQSNRFQELDLSSNQIVGVLPTSLSNLQYLIKLDLSSNSLSGQIPNVFDGLTKLQELDLYYNRLEGQIPPSLFSLSQLDYLDCSHNKLKGLLPNKITGFQKLGSLVLNNNLLSGKFPSWCLSLPSLSLLDLSTNQFTGYISAFSSYSLWYLNLCNNKLQGNIPESIFNLANLTVLCLSSNNLSSVVNFQHFSKLQKLFSLSLSHNSQLSLNFESNVNYNFSILSKLELSSVGLIGFSKLSSGKFPRLRYLDLSNNKLFGSVPNWLLEIDSLQLLGLSHNLFTSMDEFSRNHWQNLYSLDLSFNLLAGDIFLSICNKSSLVLLNLAHNKLTGTIPQCLANLSFLVVLDLQMNKFYGTIPSNFSQDCHLRTLNLNGNLLEGDLPKSLLNCEQLEALNLGSNKIEDHFPYWIQTMQYLEVLVLRENKLYGPVANINIKDPFPSLSIFDISSNNFSGPLPKAYIQNFGYFMKNIIQFGEQSSQYIEKMEEGGMTYYDSVSMTMKGNNIVMVKISIAFANIDLSQNNFEGEIPNFIGELQALKGLNLSHNRLTGPIPQSIGNLSSMESLDLSSNILTGVIPAELTNLNSLEVLNLSYNHLIGDIPQGKQFNTFSNDSYEGNIGLCGFPLSKKCRIEQHSPPSASNFRSEEKFEFGWKPVAIGYGCGFVIGIGLGYVVFLIGKPRWLVMLFGGQPKRRVNRRRTGVRRTSGSTMNQMVPMS